VKKRTLYILIIILLIAISNQALDIHLDGVYTKGKDVKVKKISEDNIVISITETKTDSIQLKRDNLYRLRERYTNMMEADSLSIEQKVEIISIVLKSVISRRLRTNVLEYDFMLEQIIDQIDRDMKEIKYK